MTGYGSTLLAVGHYVPKTRVSNAELERRFELDAGWIEQRTGIKHRRYARDDEAVSDLAVAAGERALSQIGFDPARIGLVILATSTPDHPLPPTAPLVAHRLGLTGAGAIDMAGACAGFLYALNFADAHVRRAKEPVLVIAANILSRRTNKQDRSSAILFGDGAGAVVVAPTKDERCGLVGASFASDGASYDLIKIQAGGSRQPLEADMAAEMALMQIENGKTVFNRAVKMMVSAAEKALGEAGITARNVDLFVPHQANLRIMEAVRARLGIAEEKVGSTVADYGNSSAATIPLTLSATEAAAKLKPGQIVLMAAAGAGLTGGAVVYRL